MNDRTTTYNGTIIFASKNTHAVKTQAPQISNDFGYAKLMDTQQCAHKSLQDQNKGLDSTPAEADRKALLLKIQPVQNQAINFSCETWNRDDQTLVVKALFHILLCRKSC